MPDSKSHQVWTVAEAKARLSEILRLAEEEGPQHIGARRSFVIVPARDWYAKTAPRQPMGQWLIDNMPRSANFDIPKDRGSGREIPFVNSEAE